MDNTAKPPLKEGLSSGERDIYLTDRIQAGPLRVGQARSLSELQSEYAFFTPALLYLCLRLDGADPLSGFVKECGSDFVPLTLSFNRPLFNGLTYEGNNYWDHHLMALNRQYYEPFMFWAASLAFLDTRNKLLMRIRPMLIAISDPLFLASSAVVPVRPPQIDIGVLTIESNKDRIWIDDSDNAPLNLPIVVRDTRVFRDTQVLANAILTEDHNPWARVEEDQLGPGSDVTPSQAWLIEHYGNRDPVQASPRIDISELPSKEQQSINKFIADVRSAGVMP